MLDFLLRTVLPELAATDLNPDFVGVAQEVASAEGAIWLSLTGDGDHGIFLCSSPQDAVSWLCKHGDRELLLQAIQEECDKESVLATSRSKPKAPLSPSQAPKRKRTAKGNGPGAAKYNKTLEKNLAAKRIEA